VQRSSPPTRESYKELARAWGATVTVVTGCRAAEYVVGGASPLDGFTATAFLTVSIEPPIIAVSVSSPSNGLTMLRESIGFAVNLLAPAHADIAAAFAMPHAEREGIWERFPWVPDDAGAPLLTGAVGAFSARVRQMVDAGDHVLVLGDVTAIHMGEGVDTLVYHNRGYGRIVREA
jgi:3-hydroxy-9,10-secoandrosta-1,3,5(10)-triene-9,17-dione monooxygenase reductase component